MERELLQTHFASRFLGTIARCSGRQSNKMIGCYSAHLASAPNRWGKNKMFPVKWPPTTENLERSNLHEGFPCFHSLRQLITNCRASFGHLGFSNGKVGGAVQRKGSKDKISDSSVGSWTSKFNKFSRKTRLNSGLVEIFLGLAEVF
jgi:hypothetical protein